MKVSPKQYAVALYESVKDKKDGEVKAVVKKLGVVLKNHGDLGKFDKIAEEFSKIWNDTEGLVEAEVESARELDNKMVKWLNGYIVEISGAKEVVINQKENKKILGGIIIRYKDKILDASLKGRIENLKELIN
jgi:F-type H+-transporting ATPase subunit delta